MQFSKSSSDASASYSGGVDSLFTFGKSAGVDYNESRLIYVLPVLLIGFLIYKKYIKGK